MFRGEWNKNVQITFFPGTVNSEKYKPHIAQAFYENLSEFKREYGCFKDDCATVRTSKNSIAALSNIFRGPVISLPHWSARSPVLTPRHYHLLRSMTINICRNKTHTQESTFKTTVRCAVSATSKRYLKQFCNNMFNSCQTCLNVEGCPFHHSLTCSKLYHIT
jgi:hypothetical protein